MEQSYVEFFTDADKALRRARPIDRARPDPLHVLALGSVERDDNGIERVVRKGGVRRKASGPVLGAAGTTVGPSAEGERWRVVGVEADFLVDATVAARTARIDIYKALKCQAAVGVLWYSDSLTLTASQYGGILMNENQFHQLNDNGVTSNSAAANTPRCFILDASAIGVAVPEHVKASYTANGQAGDQVALRVYYEVLP